MDIKFIVGDTHFGEERIFQKCYGHYFKTQEEYIENFILNYNKAISHKEIEVMFLGDLGKREILEKILPRLNGTKYLIKGNHDNYSKKFYKTYFKGVFPFPVFINKRIVLSHEPIPTEPGILNVHGHTHYIDLDSDRHLNAVIERTDFKPIRTLNMMKKISKLEKPNREFTYEWFKDIQKLNTDISIPEYVVLNDKGLLDCAKTREQLKKYKNKKEDGE